MSDEELGLDNFVFIGEKEDNDEEDLDITTTMMVVFTCILII